MPGLCHDPPPLPPAAAGKRLRAEGGKCIVAPKPGPRCVALRVLANNSVDVTLLISLRENAIAKEPGLS